jgi:pimeloyl-ACP methyl ester carboxylesterase
VTVEQINRTTLCYEETGSGEPLVLVHGAWVDHTTWDAVVPRLGESFRVVAYDLRGHGASTLDPPDAGTVHDDVADLVALVERLDLGPVNVAGISSGACIALRFASEHPALVRRVLPHEPPCAAYLADDPEYKDVLDETGEILATVAQQIDAGDSTGAATRFFDWGVVPWADLPADEQELVATHAIAFLGQLRDPDAVDLDPDALRELAVPVLLSEGARSSEFARAVVDALALVVPNARRFVLPDAGHVPHMTHPDAYADMVVEFVRTT